MKTRMTFDVLNVVDGAGGEIVDDVNLVATLKVCVSQVGSDKTSTARDEYSQPLDSFNQGNLCNPRIKTASAACARSSNSAYNPLISSIKRSFE